MMALGAFVVMMVLVTTGLVYRRREKREIRFAEVVAVGWNTRMLLCASVLAFQSRKVGEEFNESRTLAILSYSDFFGTPIRHIQCADDQTNYTESGSEWSLLFGHYRYNGNILSAQIICVDRPRSSEEISEQLSHCGYCVRVPNFCDHIEQRPLIQEAADKERSYLDKTATDRTRTVTFGTSKAEIHDDSADQGDVATTLQSERLHA